MYICAVEVDGRSCWGVIERAGKAEDVPEKRARGSDLVDIEARIDEQFGVEDCIPQVALAGGIIGHRRIGKRPRRRVDQVLIKEGGVAAGVGLLVKKSHERCIEGEKRRPVIDVSYRRD